jgi:hypothetical protein
MAMQGKWRKMLLHRMLVHSCYLELTTELWCITFLFLICCCTTIQTKKTNPLHSEKQIVTAVSTSDKVCLHHQTWIYIQTLVLLWLFKMMLVLTIIMIFSKKNSKLTNAALLSNVNTHAFLICCFWYLIALGPDVQHYIFCRNNKWFTKLVGCSLTSSKSAQLYCVHDYMYINFVISIIC